MSTRKIKNARLVTFTEDYAIGEGKAARVIYKKGETHAVHKNLAEKLKGRGKITVKTIDHEDMIQKAKAAGKEGKNA